MIDKNLNIKFKKSNLLSSINCDKKIDIIVANLPYIPSSRILKLDKSVKNFEPHLALDGGSDGLNLVRKLLFQAKPLISKNGLVLLELDITHTKEKNKEFENNWIVETTESKYGGVNFCILKN